METIKTNANPQKRYLIEAVEFIKSKIENDSLSVAEYQELSRILASSLSLEGTADDFARFYGKSKNNVSVVICRYLTQRPKRKVVYRFSDFASAVPSAWHDRDRE